MNDLEGAKFLDRLYKDLYKSDEVMHRVEEKYKVKKAENISTYMDRLERIHDRANDHKSTKKMLKNMYYDKYVIKAEDIPYYQNKEQIVNAQKRSLDKWIDYLSDENTKYPFWAKYWAFRGMLTIGTYSEENGIYMKRSKKTTAPFIEANPEAIAKCLSEVIKYINKEELNDEETNKLIESGNFSKLYPLILKRVTSVQKHSRNITDGKWIKYNGFSDDYIKLCDSLQNKNTGWCTADMMTARAQLCGGACYSGGDFYVYYTKDNNEEYTIPRIAIRMERNRIGEIRGVDESQNLEEGLEKILERKVKEISPKYIKETLEKIRNSKMLTLLNKKSQNGIDLTYEEIRFIMQDNWEIITFGWGIDPRIKKIRERINTILPKIINTFNKKEKLELVKIDPYLLRCITRQTPKMCMTAVKQDGMILEHVKNQTLKICMTALKENYGALQYVQNQTPEICLAAVKESWEALRYVKNQTPEICMEAVKQSGWNLQYVKNQTPELCLEAIRQDAYALRYVKNQTPEICIEAVKQRGDALQYVQNQTPEICLEAVKQSGAALEYVKNQTPEICLAAVKKDGWALRYVENQTPEICLEAVKQSGNVLEYVEEQTPEICLAAVRKNGYVLEYVENQTPEICLEAVKQNGKVLELVKNQTPEICLEAVKQRGSVLEYVEEQTPEICLAAVKKMGFVLCYVQNQTPEICLEAVKQNSYALEFVKNQTPEICLEAVKKEEGWALKYVKNQTQEICLEAVKQNGYVLEYVSSEFREECEKYLASLEEKRKRVRTKK